MEAASVSVSRPVGRMVTDYLDFIGRTDSVSSVNVVARVTGYLIKSAFKEGSDVKAGDLLFEIDPRPYQAQYDMALSQVNLSKAQIKLTQVTLSATSDWRATRPGQSMCRNSNRTAPQLTRPWLRSKSPRPAWNPASST